MNEDLRNQSFIRQTASEADGSGSMGRFLTELLFLCAIAWISVYQWKHQGNLPDALTLGALGGFCMMPYTASKAGSVITQLSTDRNKP
jgi:hypothetical protein